MESRTEKTELELGSASFTNDPNGNCSAVPTRDNRAGPVGEMAQHSVKTWLRTEIVALCIIVMIAWILLSLPIIFYHLPQKTEVSEFCACSLKRQFCVNPNAHLRGEKKWKGACRNARRG